jgi:hypothetical protein
VKLSGRLAARRRWQFAATAAVALALAGVTGVGATAVVSSVMFWNAQRTCVPLPAPEPQYPAPPAPNP